MDNNILKENTENNYKNNIYIEKCKKNSTIQNCTQFLYNCFFFLNKYAIFIK